jgi:D-alanine-D-alanine ligase-like ATP-grasp enzyme
MEFQILQGANLKNDYTTVITTFDAKPLPDFFEELIDLHEIYLRSYKITDRTVEVQTKLPHVWKEFYKALNEYFTEKVSKDETREKLYWLIRVHTGSMSGYPVFISAIKQGIELTPFYFAEGTHRDYDQGTWDKMRVVGCGKESEMFKFILSSKESSEALRIQRDKTRTNQIVSRLQMPIAKWQIIDSEEHLREIFENYPTPVVIKPGGLTRGNGVVTNIYEIDHALRAYNYAKEKTDKYKDGPKYTQKIIIQQQVEGEDYRLLMIGGKLAIATLRTPANVTGDGKSTLRELIEETNKDPRRDVKKPTHTLKPIKFDVMLDEFLTEQGLNLDTIPQKDEVVFVRKIASMSMGGMTEDATDKVHPQIKYMVESIAQSAKSFAFGIDVMCKDITKPLTVENGSFLEMNMKPEAFLNVYPTSGKQYPEIGDMFIDELLNDKPHTNKLVVIGGTKEDAMKRARKHVGERIGMYSQNATYINDELMSEDTINWQAIEALKINNSLNTIVFHYPDTSEIEEIGLGFDTIDHVYLLGKEANSLLVRMKELKRYEFIKEIHYGIFA